MARRPILTLTIKGRVATGRTALAKKIQEALKPLGLEVNIDDPDHNPDFVPDTETDNVLRKVNARIDIKFESLIVSALDSNDGFVPEGTS